jgi:hypothetical protein
MIEDYEFYRAGKMPYPQFLKSFAEFLKDYGISANKRELSPE